MDHIEDWTSPLAAQAGIVTRRQLLARGITDDAMRAHVAAGRWVPVHVGVYATFTGPLSPDAVRWAAVLACWPSAPSHDSAAEMLGLRPAGSGDGLTHVTRPFGRSTFRSDGLRVHRSRAFDHLVAPGDGLPVVSLVHTAIDLADCLHRDAGSPSSSTARGASRTSCTPTRVARSSCASTVDGSTPSSR